MEDESLGFFCAGFLSELWDVDQVFTRSYYLRTSGRIEQRLPLGVQVLSIRVSLDPLNLLGTTYVIRVARITLCRRESRVLKGKRGTKG
jgi:hypothetical protein